VTVVIPTLNEARNLPHVFALLPDDLLEVVLVDGFSTDGTVEVARRLRPDIRVVLQERRGKGNALALGFALDANSRCARCVEERRRSRRAADPGRRASLRPPRVRVR
jgi:glycosyltransferase involved in cell wall biosynthesis